MRSLLKSETPLSSEPVLNWGTVFGLFGWWLLFALLLVGFVVYSLNV
jgi:type II secretory pathway component PulF